MSNFSIGEALVTALEKRGVTHVFGIPGVHTVELYRGLNDSGLRHITPRHEQGAGFMADGYSRASGKPGVAFTITGPGLTNILTPMGQALADSIPLLIISSTNEARYLKKGLGHLHELPDQKALVEQVAGFSAQIEESRDLYPALDEAFHRLETGRPGPVHIQVPLDVFGQVFQDQASTCPKSSAPLPDQTLIAQAAEHLFKARNPVLIAGGGAKEAENSLRLLAEKLDAPVVQTINARGLLHDHPLRIPASPSLRAVQELLAGADLVLAIGTELGPTDFDIYNTGRLPRFNKLIRIDIDGDQLSRCTAELKIQTSAKQAIPALTDALPASCHVVNHNGGATKAASVISTARAELSPAYLEMVEMIETIRDHLPGSVIVGDSTQPIYAANLFYGHDNSRGWFNSSVGFGTLGYAIPAAIGAAFAEADKQIICITGDGGAQFTLPELMTATEYQLPITFMIWNNSGYQEIADAMRQQDIPPVGCDPAPPDFSLIAQACRIPYEQIKASCPDLKDYLDRRKGQKGPALLEIRP